MYKQYFFIEGKLIGSAERGPAIVHEDVCAPASILFFCEVCGDVYAKAPVSHYADGSVIPGRVSNWQAHKGLCRRHPPTSMISRIPGSIWRSWDRDFLDALPVPVLQYEFDRHFEAMEKLE